MKRIISTVLSLSLGLSSVVHAGPVDKYGKQIMGMANGVIGATIITKCKAWYTQPSMAVYMVGGVTYIGSEIFGAKAYSKSMDADLAKLAALEGDDANLPGAGEAKSGIQKQALLSQLENKRQVLKQINNRKKWMTAIGVVYGTATGLAIAEQFGMFAGKPGESLCAPDVSHGLLVKTLATAYNFGSSMGGSGNGMVGLAAGLAVPMVSAKIQPILYATVEGANKSITSLNYPAGRITWFGASAVLAGVITTSLIAEEKQVKKDIADVEKTIAALGVDNPAGLTGGRNAGGGNSGGTNDGSDKPESDDKKRNSEREYALKPLAADQNLRKTCLTTVGGSANFTEGGCRGPTQFKQPKFDSKFNLPTLQTSAQLATDMGNAVASGNMEKANVAAGDLAAMAAKINQVNENLQKKMNEKLVAEGKKPINFKEEFQKQAAALEAHMNQALAAEGMPQLAGSAANHAAGKDAGESSNNSATDKETLEVKGVSAAVAGIPDNTPGGISEGGVDVGPTVEGEATLAEKLNEFEGTEEDISKRPDVSIFKQLSHRYILNYTRFFVEKKRLDEAVDP